MAIRTKYTQQLEDLSASVRRLSDKTVEDIHEAARSLSGDAAAAESIMQGASASNRLRSAIESGCLDAMLLQQPVVAGDLRFVSGAFRLVSDLAHIDGMTREVACLSQSIPQGAMAKIEGKLASAAEKVADMVNRAVTAFLVEDADLAREVFASDDEIDALYRACERDIVEMIRSTDSDASHLPELLMVAKYFERMGDDAQRIASWAVFRVTGEHEVYSTSGSSGTE